MSMNNTCHCLTDERRGYIEAAMDFADEFPDGAFMAYMDEQGIDVSELEVFSTTHDCGKAAGK
jgi:hypothetical protein